MVSYSFPELSLTFISEQGSLRWSSVSGHALLTAITGIPLTACSEDIRMHYDRENWSAELGKWKCVIRLKLVNSAIVIRDALRAEGQDECPSSVPKEATKTTAVTGPMVTHSCADILPGPSSGVEDGRQRLRLRLAPLTRVEQNLRTWLSDQDDQIIHRTREVEEAVMTIAMCREDIKTAWRDEKVQLSLREGRIHLEESAQL